MIKRNLLTGTSGLSEQNNQHTTVYMNALEESPIVTITDRKGTILYASKKFCALSQYTSEELVGKPYNIITKHLS